MQDERQILIDSFRLDFTNECLWRGKKESRLHSKAFAVLRHLVEHSGQLVTKETLLEAVWPKVYVADTVLSVYIAEIRKALGDNPKRPRFIETVHRRGYRFIAPVSTSPEPVSTKPITRRATTTIGSQPLVGRETEVSFLQERLKETLQGRASVVFITGQAGIGKTRLVRELRDHARQRGCQWLEGQYDRAGSLPYQAWVEMVKEYLSQSHATPLQKLVGPYAEQLAKLVPEVSRKSKDAPPEVRGNPAGERFRLFEGITHFFVQISYEDPLVLFLDDLQWASSIKLVHHLARGVGNQKMLILGVYREEELKENPNLWKTVLAMNRERLFHPLPLKPLEKKEVGHLVAGRFEKGIAPHLVDLLYQKTEGNPFFVEEVLRLLQERNVIVHTEAGLDMRESAPLETPESVKAVVNERIKSLGKDAENLLLTASVIGREFPFRLLSEMVREEEETLIDLLDQCEANGLVIFQRLLGEDVYSFSHDLMQEALYDSIDLARRRRHHLQVGQAMEKLYTTRLEERYDALAHHFLEGKDIGKAVEYSLKAGEKASEASSWQRASDHFRTALRLLEKLPEDLPRQAQLLQRVADLQTLLGRSGLRYSQEALELHIRLGDKRKAARMHRLVAVAWISGQAGSVDMEKGLDQLEAAVKLLEAEPDSADKAIASSHFSHGLYHVLDLERALQQGRHALRMAEQLNDPDAVTRACTELAVALAHCGELNQAQEYAERSWEVSLRSRDPEGKTRASMYPIVEWPWRNDRAWLEQWVGRFEETRQRFHVVRHDSFMHGLSALLSALSGRPQEATEELRKAGEAFYQHPYLHPYVVHWTGAAHAVLGDWGEARRLLAESTDAGERGHHFHHNVDVRAHYGRFLLSSGNTSKAEDLLIKGYTLAHESGSVIQELNLLPLLCELHVKMERLEQAEQDLKRAKELLAWPQPWRGLAAPVYLAEGLLTTARRNWPEAERAFSCAQNAERTHGFPYFEARVLVEWGEMHVRRDALGDREQAKKLLDEALGIFRRCTAKKEVEKIEAALASL